MSTDDDAQGSPGEKAALGVLFVHGIGEQARGDTLLEFADPLIDWLTRWGETTGIKVDVSEISNERDAPVSATLSATVKSASTNDNEPSSRILLAESWWAGKFRPPPVFELAWWLLLIGTWATISHAAKPLVNSVSCADRQFIGAWNWLVSVFRATFYYTPLALSYQIGVVALSLLGAIPFGPWRSLISDLLIRLSRTLGDSFVLIRSPIQRQFVVDAVRRDILAMLKRCRRVMVVAHSQGAAISYYALQDLRPRVDGNASSATDCIDKDALSFVSVGSGLDKLHELAMLDARLSYRAGDDIKHWHSRVFYLLPVAFVGFWGAVVAWWNEWGDPAHALLGAVLLLLGIWVFAIMVIRRQPRRFAVTIAKWHDILATSDPVSNGPVSGPDTNHVIVNERSLLKDHTSYFKNMTDFAPVLLSLVAGFGDVSWLRGAQDNIRGFKTRSIRGLRKRSLIAGKWLNRVGALCYLAMLVPSVGALWTAFYSDVLAILSVNFGELSWADMRWLHAALIYIAVDIVLRWSDRTNDRTETNFLFSGDRFLWYVRGALTAFDVVLPLAVWGAICFSLTL